MRDSLQDGEISTLLHESFGHQGDPIDAVELAMLREPHSSSLGLRLRLQLGSDRLLLFALPFEGLALLDLVLNLFVCLIVCAINPRERADVSKRRSEGQKRRASGNQSFMANGSE